MGETVERFPLFPLGIVLLPSEVVPLHIFEERYKLMIGECLEGDAEFGIVWLSNEGLRQTALVSARDNGVSAPSLRQFRRGQRVIF